jgi:murein DD-endopeptidase MepM/ murein hydrolase activator NlpD
LNKVLKVFTPVAYFSKPFIYPLLKIEYVGGYGNIRKGGGMAVQHLGVDLKAEENTPVYAVNNGIVAFEKDLNTYGKTLIINHGLGIYSLYLHLNEFKAKEGEWVEQGNIIGLSGNTGYSIAPHLHFSIKADKLSIDPLKFIETLQKEMK